MGLHRINAHSECNVLEREKNVRNKVKVRERSDTAKLKKHGKNPPFTFYKYMLMLMLMLRIS